MFFQSPLHLWLLLPALALLPLGYVWLLRRRGRASLRYSSIETVRAAMGRLNWKRHVPPALMLLACCVLLAASARPVARVPLPWAKTTIVMAMDISLSMRVSDVKPTRLKAAQEAAKAFLTDLPKKIEVALVTFAGSTQVAQAATLERDALVAAIDGFQMQMGTAVGSAIVVSLAELFPDHGLDVGEMTFGGKSKARSLDDRAKPPPKQIEPVKPGSYNAGAIILLTDGRRTTGVDTLEAAKLAADRGVRIYVVGLGSNGSSDEYMPIYLQLDEPTLKEVARMTEGEYHFAATAEKLRSVYERLGSELQVQKRETELSGLLALVAGVIAAIAGALSMLWFGRV